jgi:threonine dehydrogenase-like Zn-dependent dehydrogenase
MISKVELYQAADAPISKETLAWNVYGAGLENIGRNNKPEYFEVEPPNDDQLLVRVDAVSLCFSDVKLIQQGGKHPKLYNRDLQSEPTRLGHEAALTVLQVGKNLQNQYYPGQRLAMQPDIYQNGKSTAYGYTIPGGLTQFHLIGAEVLNADDGAYVLPVTAELGYAETALTEPWACVEGAYTQRRRLEPKKGGLMWIVGQLGDETNYTFSSGLDAPATIIVTDIPASLFDLLVKTSQAEIVKCDKLTVDDYPALKEELTKGQGFDDIIMLNPHSSLEVSAAAKLMARRGTFNLVGKTPLDGVPAIDVGRIHYDYTAYVGNAGDDIAASYGENRNRCELRAGGVALFVGAGGPMGQMHLQRAIELRGGPTTLIATDLNDERLAKLHQFFEPLAKQHHKRLLTINPNTASETLRDMVMRETGGRGADDIIVSVPVATVMGDAASLLNPEGMLVLFAGVPNGSFAPLNLSDVYLHNAQFTGTSGSRLSDQSLVIAKALAHTLSPSRVVAAVGSIEAAREGLQAMMEGRFAGKIVIFPQITGLPLTGLAELDQKYPEIGAKLNAHGTWSQEAEQTLLEKFWQP